MNLVVKFVGGNNYYVYSFYLVALQLIFFFSISCYFIRVYCFSFVISNSVFAIWFVHRRRMKLLKIIIYFFFLVSNWCESFWVKKVHINWSNLSYIVESNSLLPGLDTFGHQTNVDAGVGSASGSRDDHWTRRKRKTKKKHTGEEEEEGEKEEKRERRLESFKT